MWKALSIVSFLVGGCSMGSSQEDMQAARDLSVIQDLTPRVVWADIQIDLNKKCTTQLPACHSAAAANQLRINSASGMESANYATVVGAMGLVNKMAPAKSTLLTTPLKGAGGDTHAGGSAFLSTSDSTYQRWLTWITMAAPFS